MTIKTTTLFGLAFILLMSCNNSDNKDQTKSETPTLSTPTKEQESDEKGRELTEAEKRGMRLLKSRQKQKKESISVKVKNMTSSYKYLVTTDEYPIFANLVSHSKISKHIHSADVTLLAPVDKAFDNYPDYKKLLLPENIEALDEFISYHVIDISLEYKAFKEANSWNSHAGPTLVLNKDGGITLNGARVRSGSVNTDRGSIIGMDDLIFRPEFD